MQDASGPEPGQLPSALATSSQKVAQRTETAPPGYLWLHYLFLRPRRFFRHFVVEPTPLLTAVCAWTCGMAEVGERLDARVAEEGTPYTGIGWAEFWGMVAGGGALAGLLYFVIGGWWYRVRLSLSGAVHIDRGLATRVYLFASQVFALPAVLATLADTRAFPTPAAAAAGEGHWWDFLVLVCLFWSVYVSYAGVRTAFTLRRGLAMLWFLILPTLVYTFVLGAVIVPEILHDFGPPDIEHPNTHDAEVLTFMYPGNWRIVSEDEDFDPNGDLLVEPPQDAWVKVLVYETENDVDAELTASIEAFRTEATHWRESASFTTWGSLRGLGRSARYEIDGEPCSLRMFVGSIGGGRMLEAWELSALSDLETVEPGFNLIRRTFRVKK